MNIINPSHLSDDELVSEVNRLARSEREVTVHLISHLAELDRRGLYLGAGFASLFTYCTEGLLLSEHAAYHRIVAARAAGRFPQILGRLRQGALNLTTVRLLAAHLTETNHEELMGMASGKSKREVQELLARRFPQPPVPTSIRKWRALEAKTTPAADVPVVRAADTTHATHALPLSIDRMPPTPPMPPTAPRLPTLPMPATRRAVINPLAPDRYEVRVTVNAATCEKLRLAQDLLRHAIPNGDMAEVLERALDALLEDLARKRFAATERPRESGGAADRSRHIPAKVKRVVWLRDGGRCTFAGQGGRRCGERGFLEFHHVVPYAAGGEATPENIVLRCRPHNAYEADLYYGPRHPGGEGVVRESREEYGRFRACNGQLNPPATRPGTSRVLMSKPSLQGG